MAEEAIGAVGRELHPKLLADFYYDHATLGDQAAGAKHDFTAVELEKDEVAEIVYYEIFSPMVGMVVQDLKQVIPGIDGIYIEEYISLSGRYDSNMAPPRLNQFVGPSPLQQARTVFKLGEPRNPNPLFNTTLKVKDKIGMRTFAGATAVGADYRIRAYGYIYKKDAMMRETFGDIVYGVGQDIIEIPRGRKLKVTKAPVRVEKSTWDKLAGGMKQEKPMVMPMIRYAYNKIATSQNTEYEFDYPASVQDTWEELFFDFDERDALFVKGIGVRSVPHLKYLGLKLGDRLYPRDLFRVDENNNPFHFGHGDPLFPANFPLYASIPELPMGYLIHKEKGRVVVMDDGTSIVADQIITAMQGVRVELP